MKRKFSKFHEIIDDLFKDFLASNHIFHKKEKAIFLNLWNKKLVNDLVKLGIVPKKSLILKYPRINSKFDSHFIRGYFDGDGSYHIDKKGQIRFEICSGSFDILNSIQDILINKCGLSKTKIIKAKNSNTFRLGYKGNINNKKIYNFIYNDANFLLLRKKNKIKDIVK